MLRGDIVWVDLEPSMGNEADKVRPAVVVSNNGANRAADEMGDGMVTVVPLTSSTRSLYSFQVLFPSTRETGLRATSKAQAEQMRAVSVSRVGEKMGRAPADLMDALDDAIRLHLAL